jgi:hypothetical protein
MKLTVTTLKGLIKKVIKENQMTLVEEIAYLDEKAVFDALAGKDFGGEKILTLGVMSGQNPDAVEMSPEENEKRRVALEAKVDSMGLDAIRVGGVFEGNREDSLLIINPHKAAGETAGEESPMQRSKRDAMATMDKLNQKFGQWGYVLGTKETDDPINQMRFEMIQMDKYSDRFADDVEELPGEEDYEDLHHGKDYMKDPLASPEAAAFGKKAPYSKTAKNIVDVPDDQDDYYSYPQDPTKKNKQGKKFGIPLYEVKVGKKLLRIKRKK